MRIVETHGSVCQEEARADPERAAGRKWKKNLAGLDLLEKLCAGSPASHMPDGREVFQSEEK